MNTCELKTCEHVCVNECVAFLSGEIDKMRANMLMVKRVRREMCRGHGPHDKCCGGTGSVPVKCERCKGAKKFKLQNGGEFDCKCELCHGHGHAVEMVPRFIGDEVWCRVVINEDNKRELRQAKIETMMKDYVGLVCSKTGYSFDNNYLWTDCFADKLSYELLSDD